jgi:hypothetical protein
MQSRRRRGRLQRLRETVGERKEGGLQGDSGTGEQSQCEERSEKVEETDGEEAEGWVEGGRLPKQRRADR